MDENLKQEIKKLILEVIRNYNRGLAFTDRRPTDTPADSYAPVNRRFVTLSSNVGARPVSSVAVVGQPFFDTTSNIPMTYSVGGWRNGVGSIVAQNN